MKPWPWFVGSIVLVALAVYLGLAQRTPQQLSQQAEQTRRETERLTTQLDEQRSSSEATQQKLRDLEEQTRRAQEQLAKDTETAAAERRRLEEELATAKAGGAQAPAKPDPQTPVQSPTPPVQGAQQPSPPEPTVRAVPAQSQVASSNPSSPARFETPQPQQRNYTIPAGTKIVVVINQAVSTNLQEGDLFDASIQEPLLVNGVEVAPARSAVLGQIMRVQQAGRVSGSSELALQLVKLSIGEREYTLNTGDYQLRGKGQAVSTVRSAVGAAAAGAIIGALKGGGKGAVVGAGVGGGAGLATAMMIRGEQLNIPAETVLEFTLAEVLTIANNR